MEIWDVYDEKGNKLNKTITRDKKLLDNEFHLVCDCLVRHLDGSILLMQRDPSKKIYPLFYEATAGGSALVNETPLECVKRELKEETGVECDEFTLVNYEIDKEKHRIYYSYVCTVDCPKDSIILQEGETVDYKWINESEFKEFLKSDLVVKSQSNRYKNIMIFLKLVIHLKLLLIDH